jgi:predicted dehydrogenase
MSKIRLGILGTGGMGRHHVGKILASPDADLVALCDMSEENLRVALDLVAEQGAEVLETFRDAAEMYRRVELDGVVIATPHTLHFEHGKQALEADCHVMMEKPMVTDSDDAHTLADLVESTGKILSVGYNTACKPAVSRARDMIRGKELGELQMVCGYLLQDWRNTTAGRWRQEPELSGGGMAYDSGAHLLNTFCWTIESPVEEVFAYIDNCEKPVDINSIITVRFMNGVYATAMIGGNCPSHSSAVTYVLDDGKIELDGWGGHYIRAWRGDNEIEDLAVSGKDSTPVLNFIDSILGRAEPAANARHGVIQSVLMDAIYESARTGQPARPAARG